MSVLLVSGSREKVTSGEAPEVSAAIRERLRRGDWLVVGDAYGVDRFATALGVDMGARVAVVRAAWDCYGRGAGVRRNMDMVELALTVAGSDGDLQLLAFPRPKSKGTRHMIEECRLQGITTTVVELGAFGTK